MLKQQDVDAIYELMDKTIELLEGAGIRYHIICGTALGLARHGGFIPWDNDVDLGIHVQDAEKVYALRDEFASAGYVIVRADIGFKCGSGDLINGVMQSSPNGLQATGPANPFTGVNQDIFTFIEGGMEGGVPVMRYATDRARKTWPREVIPRSGWYSTPQPTACFGGYKVQTLPPEDLRWYMCQSFGVHWDTHDWLGEPLEPWALECRWHSKFRGMIPKPKSLVQNQINSNAPHYM